MLMKKPHASHYLHLTLGVLFSGITLYLALRGVSFWEVSRTVRQAELGWVSLGVLSVLVNTFAKGFRWYRLLGLAGQATGLGRVFSAFLSGQLLNLIYPARLGDMSRILIVGKDGDQKAFALGSVILEKLADLVCYTLLVLLLLILLPLPSWINQTAIIFLVLAVILLALLAWLVSTRDRSERLGRWLATRHIRWLPSQIWLRIVQLIQMTLTAIGTIRHPRRLLELSAWTLLIWGTALLTNLLICSSLNFLNSNPSDFFKAGLLVLIALMVGIAVPSIPGRIGIFEYICVLALAVFGIAQTQALTFGILLHAVVFLPVLFMGVAALLRLSWKPKTKVSPQA